MAVKTITVDLDAYRLLAADKAEGESFSMVIKRRFRPERTARALLNHLDMLSLAEETLDRIDALIASRADHLAESTALDLED